MSKDLVSIILPVYNAEEYLHNCVNSILAQTYTEFELILIDDGSLDSSGELCERYKTHDERIRVIHQKNSGVSTARNTGLESAAGNWIMFVDNDDVLAPYAIELLLKQAITNNADIVQGTTENIYSYSQIAFIEDITNIHTEVYTPQLFFSTLGSIRYLYACHFGKLFRADIAKTYRFPDGKYGEDTFFCALVLSDNRVKRILYMDLAVYYNFIRNSSTSRTWDTQDWNKILTVLGQIYSNILNIDNDKNVATWYLYDFFKLYRNRKIKLIREKKMSVSNRRAFNQLRKEHLEELFKSDLSLFKKAECYFSTTFTRLYLAVKPFYFRIKSIHDQKKQD